MGLVSVSLIIRDSCVKDAVNTATTMQREMDCHVSKKRRVVSKPHVYCRFRDIPVRVYCSREEHRVPKVEDNGVFNSIDGLDLRGTTHVEVS